jgi:hypothetical protein
VTISVKINGLRQFPVNSGGGARVFGKKKKLGKQKAECQGTPPRQEPHWPLNANFFNPGVFYGRIHSDNVAQPILIFLPLLAFISLDFCEFIGVLTAVRSARRHF